MFQFEFMRRAFLVGFFISILIPLIGTIVVNRKTSTIGDALSHTTLGGIFFGVIMGLNPIIAGIIFSLFAAFSIEGLRNKFHQNGDMATAIITSLGIGLASILSDFVPGSQNLESYLFGSVVAITEMDILIISITTIIVGLIYYYMYYELLYVLVDKIGASLSGINSTIVEYTFTFVLAVTIAISARIVGVLIVSSLMVLPVATAMIIGKNYKSTAIFSVFFGIVYFFLGLTTAYYCRLKPGGAIITISVLGLLFIMVFKNIINKIVRIKK